MIAIPASFRSGIASFWPTLALFFAYWLLAAVIYGPSCADVPRRDDHWFMAERAFHHDAGEWFFHTLSFTRTRILAPGDYLLCRPAHYAVLTSTDLAFRGSPRVYARTSLVWLTLAALSLQMALRRPLGWTLSILAGLCFLGQYPAMEIVGWRHISPYLLALACLGFGVAAWPRSRIAAACLWTVGSLFHECLTLTLGIATAIEVAAAGWHALTRGKGVENVFTLRNWVSQFQGPSLTPPSTPFPRISGCHPIFALLLPVACYVAWNAIDFALHRPLSFVTAKTEPVPPATLAAAWNSLTTVFNAAATAFFLPGKIQLVPHDSGMLAWIFDPFAKAQHRSGAVVVALVTCALPVVFRAPAPATDEVRTVWKPVLRGDEGRLPFVIGLSLLLAVTLALGLGRGLLRGPGYLHQATYYYAFTALALLLIAGGSWNLLQAGLSPVIHRVVTIGLATWLSAMAATGAVRIHATLRPQQERLETWAADHERILHDVQRRGARLAGVVPGCEERLRPLISLLLLQEIRWPDRSKPSLYLGLSATGRPEVQPLAIERGRPLTGADRQLFRIEQHEAWAQIGEHRWNVTVLGNHPPSPNLRVVTVGTHLALMDGDDILTSVPITLQPLGGKTSQPRVKPWVRSIDESQALKGRHKGWSHPRTADCYAPSGLWVASAGQNPGFHPGIECLATLGLNKASCPSEPPLFITLLPPHPACGHPLPRMRGGEGLLYDVVLTAIGGAPCR